MRRRSIFLLLITFILANVSFAQMIDDGIVKFGNEWIEYDKNYYKIAVAEDAIYRISYNEMISSGMEASSLIGTDFQIHEFGEEIPLFVSSDELFGPNDYILFFGRKNRGEIDKYLYENPEKQLNPEYSLFTDTLVYFLSLDPGKINKRYEVKDNDLSGNLPFVEEFYWHQEKLVNHSEPFKPTYDGTNKVTYSHLDVPEGFSSPMQQRNEYTLPVSNFYNIGEQPILKVRLATSTSPHKTDISLNGKILDIIYGTGYDVTDQEIPINVADVEDNMTFTFEGTDVTTSLVDRNSQSIVNLEYPRTFTFPGENKVTLIIKPSLFPKYFEIPDLDMDQQNSLLFDVTNNYLLVPEISAGNINRFIIPPSDFERKLIIINTESAPVSADI